VPDGNDAIANVRVTADTTARVSVARRADVPKGTGDAFSGLIAAGCDFAHAVAILDVMIDASRGRPHLAIVRAADAWREALHRPSVARDLSRQLADHGPWIAGADGCPGGWIVVFHPLGRPDLARCEIVPRFADLLDISPPLAAIAVDMPIGLPETAEVGGRAADREARARLGDRQSSVFAIPARAAIACTDYREACTAARTHSDPPRAVAKQTFNLFPKIREIDAVMTQDRQDWIVECHPEVVFWALNGRRPLAEPKKVKSRPHRPGLDLRRRLLTNQGFTPQFVEGSGAPAHLAGPDDLLDACAAAWTASRVASHSAERLPPDPPRDPRGLRMEIVF